MPAVQGRDYSLAGASSRAAEQAGLAAAEWYHTSLDRKEMKAIMKRHDGPALRDTAIWWGLMLTCAAGGVAFWGGMMAAPLFAIYGVLYGSASDSRWHECGHGTAFKTFWMNNFRLPGRQLHDHARTGSHALESRATSHRHPDRRARPGDRS
jgi:fatty acid desaturase